MLGGGLLENVPVFQELATAGRSLGDVMGGGDSETARKRWGHYVEDSTMGSFVYGISEGIQGNDKHAEELLKNSAKGLLSASVTVATVGATIATAGAAAPLGTGTAAAAGGTAGVVSSAVNTGTNHALYGNTKGGDYVGGMIMGGAIGAIDGASQAKAYKKSIIHTDAKYVMKQAKADAAGLKTAEDLTLGMLGLEKQDGKKILNPKKTNVVVTVMTDETGNYGKKPSKN